MGIFTRIINNFKSVSRYKQILRVLIKYGFEDLVHYLEENNRYTFIRKLIPKASRKHAAKYSKWAKMRLVCEELGPTFVKFGQILSNRPDLVPLELTLELEKILLLSKEILIFFLFFPIIINLVDGSFASWI